jgi:phage-related protein
LADALNWAGISEDEFNKKLAACNSEQERASLITSTLNTEYAAAAEEYNKLTANTQAARDATNNMEQAQAALGAAIEPVTTAWTNMKANALQWFVDVGLPALQNGWQWIKDNLPAIGVIVGGLATAWLVAGGAQTIFNTINTAGVAIQKALNASFLASPIFWVVAGITALVAGFMLLWNNCEGFRNFWIGLWEGIKTAAKAVADWFKTAWTATIEWLKGAVAKIKEFFSAAWDGIKEVFSNSIIGKYFTSSLSCSAFVR